LWYRGDAAVHRQKTNEGLLSRLLLVSFASGEREVSE
jgi:hypothetical protein